MSAACQRQGSPVREHTYPRDGNDNDQQREYPRGGTESHGDEAILGAQVI